MVTGSGSPRRFASFVLVWLGQFVSLVGSSLTYFVLPVLVYQRTGSAAQVALIYTFSVLPGVFLSPFAGTLVDRWPHHRRTMVLSDLGAALGTLVIAWLLFIGRLGVWHIYLLVVLNSLCSAFQYPAYQVSIPLLVPKKHLGRANGMVQVAQAVSQIAAPMLAGTLLESIQFEGIILIDLATFLFAVLSLLLVHIPHSKPTERKEAKGSLLREVGYSWLYLKARPGLFALLVVYTASNFAVGPVMALFTPLMLSSSLSPAALGQVLTVGGVGALVGSLAVSAWGGPKRRVLGAIVAGVLEGLFILAGGLRQSVVFFGVAAFGFFFFLPISTVSIRTIVQTKVARDVQGRIFSVTSMIAKVILLVSTPVAGPLADYVFEPLLAADGLLAGSVGRLIGVGVGRGIALLFIVLGVLQVGIMAGGYLYPRLRFVERELPDAVVDEVTVPSERRECPEGAI